MNTDRRKASCLPPDKSVIEACGAFAGSNETIEEAFGMVMRLVRSVQSGMQSIDAAQGLSGSQLWALWLISARPGLRVAELAEALHIRPSTASNLLDKLELRGLLRRERRDADNRVVRLLLTDTGTHVVKKIPGPMQGKLRTILRELPAPLLQGFLVGLTAILEGISKVPILQDKEDVHTP